MEAVVGIVIGAAGLLASIYFGQASLRRDRSRAAQSEFRNVRVHLKGHGKELIRLAALEHASMCADPELPMLTRQGWILDRPVDLAGIELIRIGAVAAKPSPRPELRRYWPRVDGRKIEYYHDAVAALNEQPADPSNWYNGVSYQLLKVAPTDRGLRLSFGQTWYWDAFDSDEALAYEAAYTHIRTGGARVSGKYRKCRGDPFDLGKRWAIPGISVLTVRQSYPNSTFYILRRDETLVATAIHQTSLIPEGEFQPSDDSRYAVERDMNLWFCMMREYNEELLGAQDARRRPGAPIDYDHEQPYKQMQEARRRGAIRIHVLGIGLNPLTWKPLIFAVCIFDDSAFDDLFGGMVCDNAEGILELPTRSREAGSPFQGWPFNQSTVIGYANDPMMSPNGSATLKLVWRHRRFLDLHP